MLNIKSVEDTDMQLQNAVNLRHQFYHLFSSFLRFLALIPRSLVSLSILHIFLSVVLEATSYIGLPSASPPLFVETLNPSNGFKISNR